MKFLPAKPKNIAKRKVFTGKTEKLLQKCKAFAILRYRRKAVMT